MFSYYVLFSTFIPLNLMAYIKVLERKKPVTFVTGFYQRHIWCIFLGNREGGIWTYLSAFMENLISFFLLCEFAFMNCIWYH